MQKMFGMFSVQVRGRKLYLQIMLSTNTVTGLGSIMPEGPEVKRFGQDLAQVVSGRYLDDVKILSGRYTKKEIPGLSELIKSLPTRVIGVGVHGKFLYWVLQNGYFLYSSLGMTGHWGSKKQKHSRVLLKFSDESEVYYTDQRNFGTLKFVYGKHELQKKIGTLGPDMLSEDVTHVKFRNRFKLVRHCAC